MIKTFGLWLDRAIQDADLSKRDIAQRAGVSEGLVYQVTTDGKRATADFCVKIAPALGIPTDTILRRAGFQVIQSPPELADARQKEAWTLVQQVPDEHWETLAVILRALAD